MALAMETIAAGGSEIGYDVHGAGPPLVMLHGATSTGREDFAAQVPSFSKAFRLYLPDARGHGSTRYDVADGFNYGMLVDDILAFVDALGLDTFHLLGFSMGAMTALQFAARYPDRLRTLVVVGITTQREPRASVVRRLMDPDRIDRDDPAWGARPRPAPRSRPGRGCVAPAPAGDRGRRARPGRCSGRASCAGSSCRPWSRSGDHDPFVPVDHAWGLMRQLPDARLFVAPGCGHEVMVRRPGLFNEACAGFYRSTEARLPGDGPRRIGAAPAPRSKESHQ